MTYPSTPSIPTAHTPRATTFASPASPSTAYLDATERGIGERMTAVVADAGDSGAGVAVKTESFPGQSELWGRVARRVEDNRELVAHIVADLHAHPETAFQEYRSQAVLADAVEAHGIPVTRGVHGVDTALRAEVTSSGFVEGKHPTVILMAEYDALPAIGHACGHNIIASAGVNAFLAAAAELETCGAPGRLVLLGTPAEEGHTGKEYLIRGGALDGADAALMIHGFGYDVAEMAWVGRRSATIDFTGVPAHASAQPFMGRNALDAASLAYQAMGLLRQQMPPSDRLHAIITQGGDRPSVIPGSSCIELYVRSLETDTLMDLSRRIDDIVRGAALMTGCGATITWDPHPMSLPVRNNTALAGRWAATQAERGRTALPAGVVPDTLAASTDFGNVSHLVPGLHPMVKVSPADVALHTEDFARWAASDSAVTAAADSAVGLAQVALDLLVDPELLAAARAEFATLGPVSVRDLE